MAESITEEDLELTLPTASLKADECAAEEVLTTN